jgi:hypothetical protein
MAFIEKNWMLVVAFVASGLMLLWPLVQRRLSPVKEIGTLHVTQLINRENAVLLDVRAKNSRAAGCPAPFIRCRGTGPQEAREVPASRLSCIARRRQRNRAAAATLANRVRQRLSAKVAGVVEDAGLPVVPST